jgi:riboflavin kinase/FMN adenylyltransferase
VVAQVKVGGQPAKSGRIRELLSRGDFSAALKVLGHPYVISGRVVRGRGTGRRLGFPTANLAIDPRKLLPAQGVYFGRVSGIPGSVRPRKCLVNIGSRPTFGQGDLLVEVHLLRYRGNLRGRRLKVELFSRLREERQFADAEKLKAQIKKDVVRAAKMCYNY